MSLSKNDMMLLSAYLDGELKAGAARDFEMRLKASPELQQRLEEMRRLRDILQHSGQVDSSPFFEDALMHRIQEEQESVHQHRKAILTYSGIAAAILGLIIMLVVSNTKENSNLGSFSVLNGFSPIHSKNAITNEDVFNFALYNSLPFDDERKQYLEFGSDERGEEYIRIWNDDKLIPKNSLRSYYKAMGFDESQMKQLDSILGIYAEMLRKKALFKRENKLALNTNLWDLNKSLTADLVIFSVNANEDQFQRIVPSYANGKSDQMDKLKGSNILIDHNDPFLIITIDTLIVRPFEINISMVKSGSDTVENIVSQLKKNLKLGLVALNDSLLESGKDASVFQKNFTIGHDSTMIFVKFPTASAVEMDFDMDAESIKSQLRELRKQMKLMNIELNIDSVQLKTDSTWSSINFPIYSLTIDSLKPSSKPGRSDSMGDAKKQQKIKYDLSLDKELQELKRELEKLKSQNNQD